ncbi:hypothetical protein KB553_09915 [Chryseobacterium rhizoplanae]|uniref:hypothetical protein n=1 Tax=Chryseobacterium rhizoplanae TaxID=1609531 RepID=UPI001CE2F379|nr:hypothetical protein [Chryseobacterium rhizoplanae]UCA61819.1 hypothetical protein KB553_09915 [Chryseobacterium rhizoplanae]
MKKLLLLGFITFCVNFSIAQTTTRSREANTKNEVVSAVKLKKDGTPDKRYISKVPAAISRKVTAVPNTELIPQASTTSNTGTIKLKKDGTADKRYSTAKENTVTVPPIQAQTISRPAVPNNSTTRSYTPTVDRTLKGPNDEEILTGPRGGKYYINKNGNKTYIKR